MRLYGDTDRGLFLSLEFFLYVVSRLQPLDLTSTRSPLFNPFPRYNPFRFPLPTPLNPALTLVIHRTNPLRIHHPAHRLAEVTLAAVVVVED